MRFVSRPRNPYPAGTVLTGSRIGHPLFPTPTNNSWVYDATRLEDGGKYVFKFIRPDSVADHGLGEITANRVLSGCPCAAVGFDFIQNPAGTEFGYFMEKYKAGDLFEYIRANRVSEPDAARITFPVLRALSHMHSLGWAHRDVKPENVFLNPSGDGPPDAFLGDFGLAAPFDRAGGELFTKPMGTRDYMAPEMIAGAPYDESVDLWAFGVVLYSLVTNVRPFPDAKNCPDDFAYWVTEGGYDKAPLEAASPEVVELIDGLLRVDPKERFTADRAMDHSFYSGVVRDTKQVIAPIDSAMNESWEPGRRT
jgi:serine/threonine protein kinase